MRAFLQELTAPPAQTLQTLQPTPTTVSYTISTRPIPRSVTAVLVRYIGILVRLVAGLAVALLLRLKWIATDKMLSSYQKRRLGPIEELPPDSFATALQWRYLAPAALVVLFLVLKRNYTGPLFLQFLNVSPLTRYRRVSHRPSRPWHPDLHYIINVPPDAYHALHTDDEYTGYPYPRGIQGVRGYILLGCCG
jgi:hypothetical protein